MGKQWKQWQTLFWEAPKSLQMVTAAEIKRCLLLRRKVMTNLDNILKSRDITLLTKAMVFLVVMYGCESWTIKAECLGLQEDPSSSSLRKSILNIHWKYWCWGWNSNILSIWCEELTHWKTPWCWERLKAGEGDGRGWGGWMASPTQWAWVWINFGSWWWTGRPGVLQSMGLQRAGHDWATELNWGSESR